MRPVNLKCENLTNPMGIDSRTPRFSWQLESSRQNACQTARRIVVTDDTGSLLWDSGTVSSGEQLGVRYAGLPLRSRTACFWTVEVTDNAGNTSVSAPASFEMGLLEPSDWEAEWIGRPPAPAGEAGTKPNVGEIMLGLMSGKAVDFHPDRKLERLNTLSRRFTLPAGLKKARVYVTALGVYDLCLNGSPVSDTILNPGFTPYDRELEYQTFDVLPLLREGENTIEATLADGWYKGKYGVLGFGENYGSELALLLQLEATLSDGGLFLLCSDSHFTCRPSPWVYSDFFIGERYDARLENEHSEPIPCYVSQHPKDILRGTCAEPVRITRRLKPKEILTCPNGDRVLDFGQNMVGVVELTVNAPAGCEIRLEHEEVLDQDGSFVHFVDAFSRDQTDYYITKGGRETFCPRFTSHGFRYCRVTGYPGELLPENFTACVQGSDCRLTSGFTTSNEKLNRLQRNIVWSQRSNLLAIPTDCPQRERAGWTGDVWVYGATCAFNQDCLAFFRRWLRNLREEQFEDGLVPIIVPYPPAQSEPQLQSFGSHTSAGWGDVIVRLPWELYRAYGDRSILEENYEAMQKWLGYEQRQMAAGARLKPGTENDPAAIERQKHLWNTDFHFGDWLYPSCVNENGDADMLRSAESTREYIATAVFADSSELMAKIAEVLGHEEDAVEYRTLNEQARTAYEAEYLGSDNRLEGDLQGIYVTALAMNMVSKEKCPLLAQRLAELVDANGGCLDTGFISVRFLMDVLTEYGLADTANTILYQEKCPSWFYELNNGATTLWEHWTAILPDGTRTRASYNHYAFGCVGDWMYRTLLGLNALAPGYREILIRPDFRFGLTHAEGWLDSPYGRIEVRWQLEDGKPKLFVRNPPNTIVYLELPGEERIRLGSGTFEL